MFSGRGSSSTRQESTTVEESVVIDRAPREILDQLTGQGRPLPDTSFDFGRGYRFGQPRWSV